MSGLVLVLPGRGLYMVRKGETMLFWIVALAMAVLAGAFVIRNVLSGGPDQTDAASYDLKIYRDQLAEVDRDLARGTLNEAEAGRVRAEVSRRILAADRAQTAADAAASGPSPALTGCLVGAFVVLAGFGYLFLGVPGYPDLPLNARLAEIEVQKSERPRQAEAESAAPPLPAQENEELEALVAQLRQVVALRPDDVEGLRLLARNEANLGNFAAAHRAQGQMVAALGADARAADIMGHADLMILAAGGYVSPEAEALLSEVLERDPEMAPAYYYQGLMHAQTGRPDLALEIWAPLLANSDPRAPWVAPIRAQIEEAARLAGVRYTLPPLLDRESAPPPPVVANLPGPTADQIEAAEDLSPEDRAAMIQNMVQGLADRLATEGGPPQDWARLISALTVLGDRDSAFAIWAEAESVFAGQAAALALIADAAEIAGLIR